MVPAMLNFEIRKLNQLKIQYPKILFKFFKDYMINRKYLSGEKYSLSGKPGSAV
jgi:hypothetical protein